MEPPNLVNMKKYDLNLKTQPSTVKSKQRKYFSNKPASHGIIYYPDDD